MARVGSGTFETSGLVRQTLFYSQIINYSTVCYNSSTKHILTHSMMMTEILLTFERHERVNSDGDTFAWLERTFYLHPTEECVRYSLVIEQVHRQAALFVNGQHVADIGTAHANTIDITDYVALERNTIALRLENVANTGNGGFGDVRLIAQPCSD